MAAMRAFYGKEVEWGCRFRRPIRPLFQKEGEIKVI